MTLSHTLFSQARRGALALAGATALLACAPLLHAQTADAWPTKPLRLIVGYPPGSSPDVQARMLAEPLSKALGQPVVVENKPGASGNIGADLLAKSTDNHTLGVIGNGPLTSSGHLYRRLPYDPVKDFAPLALIGSAPLVWVARPGAEGETVQDYIAQARAQGDALTYGSVGAGSGGHLGMELLADALELKPLHVPYNGGPAIVTAIIGEQVDMGLLPGSTVVPLVNAGKLRALAVTSAERSSLTPDVPSLREIGVDNLDIEVWNAVMAPASLPAAYQTKLNQALNTILATPEMRQVLFQQGWTVVESTPEQLAERIQRDSKLYGELIERQGIQLD